MQSSFELLRAVPSRDVTPRPRARERWRAASRWHVLLWCLFHIARQGRVWDSRESFSTSRFVWRGSHASAPPEQRFSCFSRCKEQYRFSRIYNNGQTYTVSHWCLVRPSLMFHWCVQVSMTARLQPRNYERKTNSFCDLFRIIYFLWFILQKHDVELSLLPSWPARSIKTN